MIKDDIHSLPDDPAILRQMLTQQYQQIQLLQTENELKSRENDTLNATIESNAQAVQTLQDTIKSNAQKIDTLQTTVELHVQTIAWTSPRKVDTQMLEITCLFVHPN